LPIHAAANVPTELGSYGWLVEGKGVQRQTGRHASSQPTMETVAVAADGRSVTTGLAPRTGKEYQHLLAWLDQLGLREQFHDLVFLEMGAELDRIDVSRIGIDPVMTEIYASGRSAAVFIAGHLDAYDFFVKGQRHGLTCGIIYSPEEVIADPHFVSRGFPVTVDDDVL